MYNTEMQDDLASISLDDVFISILYIHVPVRHIGFESCAIHVPVRHIGFESCAYFLIKLAGRPAIRLSTIQGGP